MSKIPIARLRLRFVESIDVPSQAHLLRGALANLFPDEPLLHQHGRDGFLYRYPLVHYRWLNGNGILTGFHEGAHLLVRLPLLDHSLQLGNVTTRIVDMEIRLSVEEVKLTERLLRYYFVTPWLPLSQENYEVYKKMNSIEQAQERDRIAVGNLLTALRSLKIELPGRLYAAVQVRRGIPCRYKDQTFVGFLGTLLANVDIPDDMAIGRAVSHGYGWLKRVGGSMAEEAYP